MTLFMPIQPEPASRIYSGKKFYELRKFRPPTTGFVYLYETRDETATVQAIRGGFFFRDFLDLPLDKLWARVGERATSRERFIRYFGPKHKHGIALAIERAEQLANPVTIPILQQIQPGFELPRGLWTYHSVAADSPVIRYLDNLPRVAIIKHPEVSTNHQSSNLSVARLDSMQDANLFRELYSLYVQPNYPESEDYAQLIVNVHNLRDDPFGYFTKRKTIWVFRNGARIVGFTVATEKRGGSVKFGPTVLIPKERGHGIATAFRLLVERQYPNARKAYNTLPDDNLAALRYVTRAGYQVEAHLRKHYRPTGGELVVGKLLKESSPPPIMLPLARPRGTLRMTDGVNLPPNELSAAVTSFLSSFYDEVDDSFVAGLLSGMRHSFSLSHKSKRLFLAVRGHGAAGLLIATPKRGGALKCSPLVVAGEDPECLRLLLEAAATAFPNRVISRTYLHIPLLVPWMIESTIKVGFQCEGLLREPYRTGVDLVALGRLPK